MAEGSSKANPAGSADEWKSWLKDPDVVEVSAETAAGWSSSGRQKRKLTQVVPSDIIKLDADDDPDGVMIIGESINIHKNKQTVVHMNLPEHTKSGVSADFAGPSAIPLTKIGPWDGLEVYHNNIAGPSAIPVTKVCPWDGVGGYHNNVAGPSAIPVPNVCPLDGLGGYHNNISSPNAIPVTKVCPWDVPGGYQNYIASITAIPAPKVSLLNGLGGYHNNIASPNAIPVTKVCPWDVPGGYQNYIASLTAIPAPKVSLLNGLGGYHNNVASSNVIPITKVCPWDGLGSNHNNVAGSSAIPVPKVCPVDGLGGYHNNVASPNVVPTMKVCPWNGLGGYHNNIASPSAIPATDFLPWDGIIMLPPFYDQFVGAPGVEHDESDSSSTSLMESGSSFNSGANNYMDIPPGVETALPQETSAEMPHQSSQTKVANSEVDDKYKTFKQFDTVNDHDDHYYALPGKSKVQAVKKPSKAWVKRIQHEWKVLENDLSDTIYVRVYEDRMDLLRAVIVGPAGTPYHDGLFFFDVYFPSRYPSKPPQVNYRSGGLRLNPNLYDNGKVCLSLLNTWEGTGCEKWSPSNSTMLQVLVSIQALVLNAKPYFNEPGYELFANSPHGEKLSMMYNEEFFLLSCTTMQYSLRNPPKHFEDFIVGHFRTYGYKILNGCKSYMAGAQVGCLIGDGVQDVDEGDKSCSTKFKASLKVLFVELLKQFSSMGVNCDEFQYSAGAAKAKLQQGPH